MIFTIGVVLMCLGWWLAMQFGDWANLDSNWFDKIGTWVFATGAGLTAASVFIAAIKYLP